MTPRPPRTPRHGRRPFTPMARIVVAFALIALCLPSTSDSQVTFEVLKGFEAPFVHGESPYAGLIQGTDGSFYGTTRSGGSAGLGTIFRFDATGALTTLHHFAGGSEGAYPYAGVIEAADGNLYGTTLSGGIFDSGTIFRLDAAGTLTTLHTFPYNTLTYAGLVQAADGSFYGMNRFHRDAHGGTIFRLDAAGAFTIVHSFSTPSKGESPFAGLTLGPGGILYGTTEAGGTFSKGTVFRFDAAGTGTLTVLHSFTGGGDGDSPWAELTLGRDGSLYGTAVGGATGGTVFKVDAAGTFTTLHAFSGEEGANPAAHVIQGTDGNLYGTTLTGPSGWSTIFRLDAAGTLTTLFRFSGEFGGGLYGGILQAADGDLYGTTQGPESAGTLYKFDFVSLTTLYRFIDTSFEGAHPHGGLVQGADGSLYGTTRRGGTWWSGGTLFRLDSAGVHTTLHSFNGSSYGSYPWGPLVQGADGSLYGSTERGPGGGTGTVFRLDTAGTVTTLHNFTNVEGYMPHGGVTQGSDGGLYGTTVAGGPALRGTVFKLDTTGILSFARSFTGSNGAYPDAAPIQASDGNVYGTTASGGTFGRGTVFKLDSAGTLTTQHHFTGGIDGASPYAGLTEAADGSLLGTTQEGGAGGVGTVFKIDTAGSGWTLHSFSGGDGAYPIGGVIQGADGSLYGTTSYGGMPEVNAGTIFKLDATGTLTTLHRFDPERDGRFPYGQLMQAADGSFYGTTSEGGPNGGGTVFRLTVPSVAPLTFSLSQALIAGCLTTKGVVTLLAPAPPGGTVVTLTSGNVHAPVPGTLKVAAGKLTKTFTIKTTAVAGVETAIIDASIGGVSASQALTLKPMGLTSMTLSPTSVIGGSLVSGTVKLECAAGPSPVVVALSSSKPAASPTTGTVTIPVGMTTFPFTVTTTPVTATAKPVITATVNGVTKSKTLTVKR